MQRTFGQWLGLTIQNFLFKYFDLVFREVQVGVSERLPRELAHGNVFIQQGTRRVPVPFVADKPQWLEDPTQYVLEGIFRQFVKMGYRPVNLELLVGQRYQNYALSDVCPQLLNRG